jgi:hypothetical protein
MMIKNRQEVEPNEASLAFLIIVDVDVSCFRQLQLILWCLVP